MTMPVSPVPRPSESSAAVLALRQSLLDKTSDDDGAQDQAGERSVPEVYVEVVPSSDPDDSPEQPNDET